MPRRASPAIEMSRQRDPRLAPWRPVNTEPRRGFRGPVAPASRLFQPGTTGFYVVAAMALLRHRHDASVVPSATNLLMYIHMTVCIEHVQHTTVCCILKQKRTKSACRRTHHSSLDIPEEHAV